MRFTSRRSSHADATASSVRVSPPVLSVRRTVAAVALMLVALASSGAAGARSLSDSGVLVTDIRTRSLADGEVRCRVSGAHEVSPAFGPALGPGPVYPITLSTITFEFPPGPTSPFADSGWAATKTLWVAPRRYQGPIRIRGRQLDGDHVVRFSLADGKLLDELYFKARSSIARSKGAEHWRQFPTYTRLQASGCYAFTISGASFARTIFFRARMQRR